MQPFRRSIISSQGADNPATQIEKFSFNGMGGLPLKKADSLKEGSSSFCIQNGPIKVQNVGDSSNFIKDDSPIKLAQAASPQLHINGPSANDNFSQELDRKRVSISKTQLDIPQNTPSAIEECKGQVTSTTFYGETTSGQADLVKRWDSDLRASVQNLPMFNQGSA